MKEYSNELTESRFIRNTDEQGNVLLYPIPNHWWSRLYEYIWAKNFVEENDVCLDAACGTFHHFKFYLATKCKEVYACDLDEEVTRKYSTLLSVRNVFGQAAYLSVNEIYDKIRFSLNDITNLSYENEKFDKVYCISVLEHLPEDLIGQAFKELTRVLKQDGLLVLTFDYPDIKFDILKRAIDEAGLQFYSTVDFEMPSDVLESWNIPGLKCFRALLKKK